MALERPRRTCPHALPAARPALQISSGKGGLVAKYWMSQACMVDFAVRGERAGQGAAPCSAAQHSVAPMRIGPSTHTKGPALLCTPCWLH